MTQLVPRTQQLKDFFVGELQVIARGLGFQGNLISMQKDIWHLLKNYIVDCDQYFLNTFYPIYHHIVQ